MQVFYYKEGIEMQKVGILGTGWIAAYHVQALKKLNIEVYVVV